jgi:hypothetical protein
MPKKLRMTATRIPGTDQIMAQTQTPKFRKPDDGPEDIPQRRRWLWAYLPVDLLLLHARYRFHAT